MKPYLLAIALVLVLAGTAYAYCRTYTIIGPDGQFTVCTECCYGGSCTVTCV